MKKMFAIVLALMLCIGVMSVAASAAFDNVNSLAIVGTGIPGVKDWTPEDPAGDMTEVSEGIYEKTLDLPAGTSMNFKIAGNDAWDDTCNFGSANIVLGEVADLECSGGSGDMNFTADSAMTIKITVDLTGDVATILVANVDGSDPVDPPVDDPVDPPVNDPVDPPAGDVSYYVAGVEALCGSNWVQNDENNKMTAGDNGIYSITYKNVAAGDYSLKVTDGTWDNSWGGEGENGNYDFKVEAAADVVVEFDSVNKVVTVKVGGKAPESKPENNKPVDPNANYFVAGVAGICGSEWKENDPANKMTYKDGVYTITYKDVAAGKYSLKVTDGTWINSWGGNGENGNFDFEVTAKNDVTVEFNPAKGQVSIIIGNERIDGPATTGDVSLAAVSVALLAATAGLVAIVSKKKEF